MRVNNIQDRILYEDKSLIVCHKPAGMAVQNARIGVIDLESALKNYLVSKGEEPYLAVIHRLDQPVEGVIVFAKTAGAAKELNRQLTAGEVVKEYLAVTTSKPIIDKGEFIDYLIKDGKTNTSRIGDSKEKTAKKAVLSYCLESVISCDPRRYLIRIRLQTGRHHQIRVQMAHANMPLLGDRKYNSSEKTAFSLGLCAVHLSFVHPATKKRMDFEVIPDGPVFGFKG